MKQRGGKMRATGYRERWLMMRKGDHRVIVSERWRGEQMLYMEALLGATVCAVDDSVVVGGAPSLD